MQVEVIRRRTVVEAEHFLIVLPDSVDPDDLGDDDLAEIANNNMPYLSEIESTHEDETFEVAAL